MIADIVFFKFTYIIDILGVGITIYIKTCLFCRKMGKEICVVKFYMNFKDLIKLIIELIVDI